MAETTKVNVVQIQTDESVDNLSALKKQIKDLKSELLGLEEGTEDYNKKIKELGDAQFKLKDINEKAARNMTDTGEQLANVSKLASGATSAMAGFTGVLQLMGAENENTEKLTQNIISLMAVAQSFSAIEDSIDVFKNLKNSIKGTTVAMSGLKKAMLASGIGVAVAAIGVAINQLNKLNEKAKETSEHFKELGEKTGESLVKFELLRTTWLDLGDDLKAKEQFLINNKKQFEDLGIAVNSVTDAERLLVKNSSAVISAIEARADAEIYYQDLVEARKTKLEADENYEQKKDKLYHDRASKRKIQATIEYDEALEKYNTALKKVNEANTLIETNTITQDTNTNSTNNSTTAINEKVEALKRLNDIRNQGLVNAETEVDAVDELPTINTGNEEFKYDNQSWEDYYNSVVSKANEVANAEIEVEAKKAEVLNQIDTDLFNEQQARQVKRQELLQTSVQASSMIMSATSELFSTLQSNLDLSTKKGFEQNKKFEKANATIAFLQGLISAWSSSMQLGPIAGPIAGGILSGILTATYGVNMAKINSTTFDSNSVSSVPNSSAINTLSTNVTNVRNTPTESDFIELGSKQPAQKVFVLASDIEQTLNGRKTAVRNSSF